MSEALHGWVARYLPQPGIAAWAVRLPNGAVASQCYTDWLPAAGVENALTCMALAADNLGQHSLQAGRLCWVFEHARIHLGRRSDGACLALFVENRPGPGGGKVEYVLQGFLHFDAGVGAESGRREA